MFGVERNKPKLQDYETVRREQSRASFIGIAPTAGLAIYFAACLIFAIKPAPAPHRFQNGSQGAAAPAQLSFTSSIFISSAYAGNRGRRNSGGDDGDFEDMAREQRHQQHEAERQARQEQREAERESRQQQRDADRQAREQQREAERTAREEQRQTRRQDGDGMRPPSQEPPSTQPVKSSDGWGDHARRDDDGDHSGQNGGGKHTDRTDDNSGGPERVPGKIQDSSNVEDTSDEQVSSDTPDDTPPTTVMQWFSQPAKPLKPQKAAVTAGVKQRIQKANKPIGGGGSLALALPEFARPEILAVNATAKTLERAQALGFQSKGATSFANLNYGVTRLVVPQGMSAADAQALLNKEVPQATVAINQTYRIYRTATGAGTEQQAVPASVAPPGGALSCGLDRCFASDIVGWKPALRSCAVGLKIGIIDTSVDVTHPAFAHKKIELRHLGQNAQPGPDWHGTGVTALLAGDASSGTPGLIPNASFYVADVFRADSAAQPVSDTFSMLRAFDWLEAKNVKLINMSLSGPPDALIGQAIKRLAGKGIVFVAAAGNDGPAAAPSYPAAYEDVIAVTAVGKNLKSYRYANRGSYIDVAAPGVGIWTALPGSKEGYHSGTSFAAPYVTAALAAVYAQLPAGKPGEILKQLKFRDLGDPGPDAIYGQGLFVAPVSCGSGQIAKVLPNSPVTQVRAVSEVSASSSPAASLGNPPPYAAASEPPEILPWLALQNSNN